MTPRIRLIATDLDGTLLHSDGAVGEANREAIWSARESAVRIVVCTGRRHSYAMQVLQEDFLEPHEFLVSSNGAVARTSAGELLWRHTLPADLVKRLCAALHGYRDAMVLTSMRVFPKGAMPPPPLRWSGSTPSTAASADGWRLTQAPCSGTNAWRMR